MKKYARLAATVALSLAFVYTMTAALLGRQLEATLGDTYRHLADKGVMKVVERNYHSGFFSASEELTLELLPTTVPPEHQAALGRRAETGGQPLRLTLRSHIRHGPFIGFGHFAAGKVATELAVSEAVGAALQSVFGYRRPFALETVINFSGGGALRLSSPPFKFHWGQGNARGRVDSGGLSVRATFAQQLTRYSWVFELPAFALESGDGKKLALTGMKVESEQQRIAEGDLAFYTGSQKLSLKEVSLVAGGVARSLQARELNYELSAPCSGGFLDISLKLGAKSIRQGAQEYGAFGYDMFLRRIHARSFVEVDRNLTALSRDPHWRTVVRDNPAQVLATVGKPILTILQNNPEIRLDRASFSSAHGDVIVEASARLTDVEEADLAKWERFAGKLDARIEVSLPEVLATELTERHPGSPERLATLVERGLVTRNQGKLKMSLVFAKGRVTANGKVVE